MHHAKLVKIATKTKKERKIWNIFKKYDPADTLTMCTIDWCVTNTNGRDKDRKGEHFYAIACKTLVLCTNVVTYLRRWKGEIRSILVHPKMTTSTMFHNLRLLLPSAILL